MLALSPRQFNKALVALGDGASEDGFDWVTTDRVTNNLPTELCGTCSGGREGKSLKRSA